MLNLLVNFLDDAQSIDTSAVDKVFEWIKHILNTNLVTIGGTTLTVGLLLVALIKFFFPKNKIVAEQEVEIVSLKAENNLLKDDIERKEARLETLESQMSVVLNNNPNKKVRDARYIKVSPQQTYSRFSNIDYKHRKKKVRVKVKKNANSNTNTDNVIQNKVEQIVEDIKDKVESEVMSNGN